eukprot:1150852-Pelagomonas_calceolata.AAC.3
MPMQLGHSCLLPHSRASHTSACLYAVDLGLRKRTGRTRSSTLTATLLPCTLLPWTRARASQTPVRSHRAKPPG